MQICNKKFYNTSFWRHMATVHAQESKLVHECKICGRKFSFAFKLKLHQKSHLNYEEREYVCRKVCGISFILYIYIFGYRLQNTFSNIPYLYCLCIFSVLTRKGLPRKIGLRLMRSKFMKQVNLTLRENYAQ